MKNRSILVIGSFILGKHNVTESDLPKTKNRPEIDSDITRIMDSSVGSAIEQIKVQEQNQQAKLKAKRELESTYANVERSIKETTVQVRKIARERSELLQKASEKRSQLTVMNMQRDALAAQLVSSSKELEGLKRKADLTLSEVHKLRSKYIKAVHESSDQFDLWPLLIRPTELFQSIAVRKSDVAEPIVLNEDRLKEAVRRKEKAVAERNRLLAEPDNGEEFVRIKNALRYSMEMTANLRK